MDKVLITSRFLHLKLIFIAAFMLVFSFADAQLSITCPSDISENSDPGLCSAVVTFSTPTGSGSGTGITVSLTSGLPSGSAFPVGTSTVTFTVTNNEGDSESCSFNVIVTDVEDPVFDCPDDILVDAGEGECTATVVFDTPDVTDNCGVTTITQIGGLPSGSDFPVGENNIDFQAQDDEGNSAFCRFQIIVADITDPTITCPDNISVGVFNSCDTTITYTAPVGTDACTTPTTTQTGGLGSGSSFPIGTTIEEYTVTDGDGNTATCSFSITVTDAAAPEITCPGDITVNTAPDECDAIVNFADATATDNCPGAISIVQSVGPLSGDAFPVGITAVEFIATDLAGNSSTCSFNVTVEENILPEIDCPEDIAVDADAGNCEAVVTYTPPTGTDNCPGANTTLTSGLGSGSAFPVGTTTETYTVTDASGNEATCSFDITVSDNESPVITCPADITVSADAGECDAVVTFADATATDNCPGVTVSQTNGPASGSAFPIGDTTVEFTAEDAAGNIETCTFTVTVEDDEDPVITCPADIAISIPGGDCTTTLTYPDPTVTDNCPGAGFTVISGPESGDEVSAGDYVVELEATDAAGNTATCSFNVSIEETSIPVFDCPDDLTVPADAGSCEAVVTFSTPTASDSCSVVTVTQTGGPASGSTFPAGSTAVEFTAEDEFGNTETCSFNIVVEDDSPPEITCPDDIVTANDAGICGSTVAYDVPTGSDNCGIASIVQTEGLGPGSEFPVGITTETYVVTDVSGNTDTCSFTITVVDEENPEITCPADILEILPDGDCEAIVTYSLPVATDNCGIENLELISGLASGSSFPTGENTVTYEATDAAGNTATCSFTVTVQENVDPTIDCPADISVPADADLCGATVTYTGPEGLDDCPGATTEQIAGLGSGSFFPVGTTTETYEVTDASGNQVSCSFTITVTDEQDPEIACPEDITVSNDPDDCEAIVNFDLPVVNDNCDDGLTPVQTAGPASGSAFPVGTTTISFEATDLAGNTASCSFEITVEDTELPEITCPADIVVDAASGDCEAEVNYTLPTATDNCPGVAINLTEGLASGSEFPIGITTVTYEAVDAAGNVASCSFTVSVSEDVPPEITCPDDIAVDNDPGACGAVVAYDAPVATDNCGDVEVELTTGLESGVLFPVGVTTVTYTATDLSGNETTCSFSVTVNDNEEPVVVCPDDITLSAAEDDCTQIYDFEPPEATDNCTEFPDIVQTAGPVTGSVLSLGTTSFEFEITDDAGNTAICAYDVTVVDDLPPVFTECPESFDVFVDGESCESEVSFDPPAATDNCEVNITQTAGPTNGDVLPAGTYNYVFTGTDNAGNTSECAFTVNVLDTISPAISCPESIETCESLVEFDLATATDNCGIDTIVQIQGPQSGTDFPVGDNTITFEATDLSGNASTCSFVITVLQTAPRADAGGDQNICEETETTLQGNAPGQATGTWTLLSGSGDISSPNDPNTDVTGLEPGENSFIWSLDPGNGCTIETDTVSVTVEENVIVDAGDDQIIFAGSSVTINTILQPSGGDIIWEPEEGLSCIDCQAPTASPGETTLYFITYTTALGCEKTDSVFVRVFEELPNTITPDGDGVNDVWNIPNIEDFPDVYVVIYNRWGNEVYKSTGYNDPWDGTQNGKDLPTGSYYYIIDYNLDGKENLNGTVNIIR